MSEQDCSNPGGYHKKVYNLDHVTFHRLNKMEGYFKQKYGGHLDTDTILQRMMDAAAKWEQLTKVFPDQGSIMETQVLGQQILPAEVGE